MECTQSQNTHDADGNGRGNINKDSHLRVHVFKRLNNLRDVELCHLQRARRVDKSLVIILLALISAICDKTKRTDTQR